jgi:SAP domain.
MALWVCNRCTTKYAVGLGYCPQCTSTDYREDGDVPKNTVHGGASNADAESVETEARVEANKELTIVELRDELRERGLKVSGSKDELAARLAADDAKAEALAEVLDGSDDDD